MLLSEYRENVHWNSQDAGCTLNGGLSLTEVLRHLCACVHRGPLSLSLSTLSVVHCLSLSLYSLYSLRGPLSLSTVSLVSVSVLVSIMHSISENVSDLIIIIIIMLIFKRYFSGEFIALSLKKDI